MGGVVSAIGGALSGAFEFVGNIEKSIVHTVEGAAKSVGKALESVGKQVSKDPIGTLAKVAAVVTQQYWALPLISAATVVAHGGSLMDAAIAGGVSYIGGEIASGLGDYLSAGAESTLEGVSKTAEGTLYSYSDGSTMLQSFDGATSFTAPTILSAGAANAIGGAAANAATTLARTGDIEKALTAGIVSGAAGYAGGELASEFKDMGMNSMAANMAAKIGVGTAVGAATGKDAGAAFEGALASTLYKSVMDQAGSALKSTWNEVNSTISQYNKQLEDARALVSNELTPAQQEATAAQEQAKASYDDYKAKSEQFDDLVSKYDAAKAAGDTAAANDYADQANALIPQLNAATDKFNADSTTYDNAMSKFDSLNAKYESQIAALDQTKASYETQNADLAAKAEELAAASKEVAGMSEEAQTAFTNATSTGADIAKALETSTKLNDMTDSAQSTFNREFANLNDVDASLARAEQVESLGTNQVAAYDAAIKNNLDYNQALTVAAKAENYNAAGQEAYAQALKAGNSEQDAATLAIMSQLASPETEDFATAAPVESEAPVLATATAPTEGMGVTATQAPSNAIEGVYHKDPNTGMWSVVGKDAEGKDITLVSMAQGAGAPLVEGASAGQFNVSTDPNAPAEPVSSAPTLVSETTDPQTGNVTQVLSDGTTRTLDAEGNPITAGSSVEGQPGAVAADGSNTTTPGGVSAGAAPTGGPNLSSVLPGTTAASTAVPKVGTTAPKVTTATSAPVKASTSISSPLTWSSALSKWVPTGSAEAAAASPVTGVVSTGTPAAATATGAATPATSSNQIIDLTPGLTKGSSFQFANSPEFNSPLTNVQQQTGTPDYASQILAAAHGGHIKGYAEGQSVQSPDAPSPNLRPTLTRGSGFRPWGKFNAAQMQGYNPQKFAAGGNVPEGHNPQFFSQGGLNSLENTYVKGEGDGTSDSVAAMLANGEFVIPADVVSNLGNGSNDAGAEVLDEFLKVIREHKQSANAKKLPPDSKGALAYLLDAKRKVS